MTGENAINYIENSGWSTTRLGLGRTFELLKALGDPQESLKFVHVAGSNGKGSTCAFLESVLRKAGFKTGLYTTPFLTRFTEQIKVNNEEIPLDALGEVTEEVKACAEEMEDHPSRFELLTAAAFLYFKREKCDIVVLEVGMGGELDSTNVISAPEVAVITNIGLEHTEYLGNTLTEIAHTKGGIVKPGTTLVSYDGEKEVSDELSRICAERGVKQIKADFSTIELLESTMKGQKFSYRGRRHEISLLGAHQLKNAAVAIDALNVLREKGYCIQDEALESGLKEASWPARLELLGEKPVFLLDGGHNPQCATALSDSLEIILGSKKAVFIIGVLADKDYESMIASVEKYASEFICLEPFNDRALSKEELKNFLIKRGNKAETVDSVEEAVDIAAEKAGESGYVVAFGSLYIAGFIREAYLKSSLHNI